MNLNEIPKFVLNLEKRIDRLEHIQKEMSYIGWDYELFKAVDTGCHLGCTLSHVAIIDIAIENVRKALGTEDVELGYYLFAHHQITEDGKKPFLQVHLDWSPGTYMVDLHLGGNRDWSFIAHDKEFITKPNQAILVQPEIDLHYREPWKNDDKDEDYQAVFFHLIRKRHWKNKHGFNFQQDKDFLRFQQQRIDMFESLYFDLVDSIPELSPTTIGDDTGLTEDDKRILGVDRA